MDEMILYMALMVYVSCVSGADRREAPTPDETCTCAVRLDRILRRLLNICNQMYLQDKYQVHHNPAHNNISMECDRVFCSYHKSRAEYSCLLYQRYIINRRNAFGLFRGARPILSGKGADTIRSPCDVAPEFDILQKFERFSSNLDFISRL